MTNDRIDFDDIVKKGKQIETRSEHKHTKDAVAQLIDSQGIRGFFRDQRAPEPTGIVLDYDVESVKETITQKP